MADVSRLALLGHPVGHSLSPAIHNGAFRRFARDALYVALSVPPDELRASLRGLWALGFTGLNVTVPLKEAVIPHLAGLSDEARRIGAVNTLERTAEGWVGHNTDARGFAAGLPRKPHRAVVLGSGGAARAVLHALAATGAEVRLVARSHEKGSRLAAEFGAVPLGWDGRHDALEGADLVVNATPVGQWPHEDLSPLDGVEGVAPGAVVYDLVYRPPRTRLLAMAEERGCETVRGTVMLAAQAALGWEIWFGVRGPDAVFLEILDREGGKTPG